MSTVWISSPVQNSRSIFPFFLQFGDDALHTVDGDGKPEADAPLIGRVDHGIHPDDFAERIDERTAAVPRVDRRIRLDHPPVDTSLLAPEVHARWR